MLNSLKNDDLSRSQYDEEELNQIPNKFPVGYFTIKEILPDLSDHVIIEILKGNENDIAKSTDAALALSVSLESEQGSTVINTKGSDSSSIRILESVTTNDDYLQDRLLNANHLTSPISNNRNNNNNNNNNKVIISDTDKSNKNKQNKDDNLPHAKIIRGNRGSVMSIPISFLEPPRYRLTKDRESESYVDFTIVFRREQNRLGITVHESNGEIIIHEVHNLSTMEPMLAAEAGVKAGDILTGINFEYFSPGVEIQDVVDILQLAGNYVTLHFSRKKINGLDSYNSTQRKFHKAIKTLLQHNVITSDQIRSVDKLLSRQKERVMQWDNGWISQRIESWRLDPKMNNYDTTNSNSNNSLLINKLNLIRSNSNKNLLNNQSTNLEIIQNPNQKSQFIDRRHSISDASAKSNNSSKYNNSSKDNLHLNNMTISNMNITRRKSTNSNVATSDIVVLTKNLRPALSMRILRAEAQTDFTTYVIWVLDVKSGVEWITKRRFREFFEFRETLISIRESIETLEFPIKRIQVKESPLIVEERLKILHKFLRKLSSLICINSLHPSTTRVQLALQRFLNIDDHIESIMYHEANINSLQSRLVQVYVHSIMQMSIMEKIATGFIDTFTEKQKTDYLTIWNEDNALQ
eukprot:gene17045-23439_t